MDTTNYLYTLDNIDNMAHHTGGYGIAEFMKEETNFDIESEVSKDELYKRYVEFCRKEKKFRAEKNIFFKEFYKLCGDKVKVVRRSVNGRRVWKILGIRLK